MKKILLALLLVSSVLAFSEERKVSYEKMIMDDKTKISYVDGEKKPFTGIVERKYSNGKVEALLRFKDGKLNGKSTMYNSNGKLDAEENYVDGLLNGITRTFYEDG